MESFPRAIKSKPAASDDKARYLQMHCMVTTPTQHAWLSGRNEKQFQAPSFILHL